MKIKELKPEDVKVGIRTYYRQGNLFGTITKVIKNLNGNPDIIITWDDGRINPLLGYMAYVSEVIDSDCFFISFGKN